MTIHSTVNLTDSQDARDYSSADLSQLNLEGLDPDEVRRVAGSIALVRQWLEQAAQVPTARSAELLAGVLRDPKGLAFTVGFVDEVVRPEDTRVAARSLRRLASQVPEFLPWWMRSAVRVGGAMAPVLPDVVVPISRRVLRQMVSHLIIDSRPKRLGASIAKLRRGGVKLNMNLLGEAVLGKDEAARRLAGTKQLLARDDVDYVSIKVSSTVAPHSHWAFDRAVEDIVEQLTPLFEIAADAPTNKFVNLDMEEYRDLDLTIAVFIRLLDKPQFHKLSAGIVLQTYLPDALAAMIRLQEWSAQRRADGGADIKVRVVKGANLPMEVVEADVHGWPLATWHSKQESDTNYKRVLDYALTPERLANVRVGIAGHNLFEIAYSWLLAKDRGISDGIEYEMLLGMAQGQAQAVTSTVGSLRLYTPVVAPDHFDVAIAYLIRRLEEGAATENFMSAVFDLVDNDELFAREQTRFVDSVRALDRDVPEPNRVADRHASTPVSTRNDFRNCPDTDPAVAGNRVWAQQIVAAARDSQAGVATIDAAHVSDAASLERLLGDAASGGAEWGATPAAQRAAILRDVGAALEANRALLIEVAMSETGKTVDQADPEISEAVDFAYYYADQAEALADVDGAVFKPDQLTLITPPWNFPLAIPTGSTLAALAAGSGVVLKPAGQARRCGGVLADIMWNAGVPRSALTLLDVDEQELGAELICDERINRVILTGGYETAALFRTFRPELPLLAETSGKNAIIVTPSADIDLAVKDIVASAFGHAGQKCSAASLVVLVGSVATSQRFRNQLIDAVTSLSVGSPFDLDTQVSRVVETPAGKLLSGLTELGEGETWWVEPKLVDADGDDRLWSPGVRANVARGSAYHHTEYFGPILGVMTARDLDEAIDIVNEIEYGLTSGIHSLDEDEVAVWLERIQAGNLYVNRGITGAIVRRQPFGGWKRSAIGAGAKAGGPNYLFGLGSWRSAPAEPSGAPVSAAVSALVDTAGPALAASDRIWLARCVASDAGAWRDVYAQAADVSGLTAERNILRYRPVETPVVIRFAAGGSQAELIRVAAAALAAESQASISSEQPLPNELVEALSRVNLDIAYEDARAWQRRLQGSGAAVGDRSIARVRLIGAPAAELFVAADGRPDVAVWADPVTESGRVELLPFLREQAVSITAHRFGTPSQLAHEVI